MIIIIWVRRVIVVVVVVGTMLVSIALLIEGIRTTHVLAVVVHKLVSIQFDFADLRICDVMEVNKIE